jgi:NAD(P)-dependent dehydrogenase (short-subunit alcohol dehydrogenase family)
LKGITMELADKNVLITGGSRGLGRALAIELAARGAKVVIVARHREALDRVVDEIRQAGGSAHAIEADVSDKEAIYPIAGRAAALTGPIDILVNAASTLGPTPLPLLLDTQCEDLEAVLETNLTGPFRLTKAVLGPMVIRNSGIVVNISSDAAVEAYGSWGAYGASKAALDHLTRIWAAELSETGVRIFAVDPGEMDTVMHAEAIPDADPSTLAKPEEIAGRVIEMLLDTKNATTGSRLVAPRFGRVA